jgi:UDP-xylose/UDP-N-acetylglucosamine transporter B4
LEWATTENPRIGTLITFVQYVIITIFGLQGRFTTRAKGRDPKKDDDAPDAPSTSALFARTRAIRLKPLAVPISRWIIQVVLFFGVSLLNNLAFGYRVPMAVHIVFRSGGLVVNMVLGYFTQGRRYNRQQIIAVVVVSVGIAVATTSGAKQQSPSPPASTASGASATTLTEYSIGITMLAVALVLSTFLGFSQEETYEKYGRHWEEGMFFLHFLALPMFAFFGNDLRDQIRRANASPRVSLAQPLYMLVHGSAPSAQVSGDHISAAPLPIMPIPKLGVFPITIPSFILKKIDKLFIPLLSDFSVPSFWIPLTINLITQLVCVSGVNRLTSRVSSLTVVLVLALRKAVSLVISVVLIGRSSGNIQFWAGSGGVLLGTILYAFAPKIARGPPKQE